MGPCCSVVHGPYHVGLSNQTQSLFSPSRHHSAFVHALLDIGEEIYVCQIPGFKCDGDFVLALNKSVYVICQAPQNFFLFFSKHFESLGLCQSNLDLCLVVSKTVVLVCYMDDDLLWAQDLGNMDDVIVALQNTGIQICKEGDTKGFLGVVIKCLSTGNSHQIRLTQAGCAKCIVEAHGLCSTTSAAISTPAEVAPLLQDVNSDPASGHFNYAVIIGMLLYLSGHSRPDIALAVHQCVQFTFSPACHHVLALICIGHHLKGTMD
ncbi:hypothetical protein ACHAW6_015643 [Cyclotella cf. meneghiniana]